MCKAGHVQVQAGHVQDTCRTRADHVKITCRMRAGPCRTCAGHVQDTCRSRADHVQDTCRTRVDHVIKQELQTWRISSPYSLSLSESARLAST